MVSQKSFTLWENAVDAAAIVVVIQLQWVENPLIAAVDHNLKPCMQTLFPTANIFSLLRENINA